MNEENAPKIRRRPASGSGSSRIDIVSQKPGGPRRTSAASCVEPALVDGIKAAAARSGESISSFIRQAVEAKVRLSCAAAGLPWPPVTEAAVEAEASQRQ